MINVWFQEISIIPPPAPMEGYLKFQGDGWSRGAYISKGCGGEKSNIFPEDPRALSEENLPILHLRFGKSTNR